MEPDEQKADFCIHIDFDKNAANPGRIFQTMKELIDSFEKIDQEFGRSIDSSLRTVMMLEDIEAGSLKTYLRTVLTEIDDDAIKSMDWKKQAGKYLVKAKYIMLDFLKDKTTITDADQVRTLQANILAEAEKTDIRHFPNYAPVSEQKLIEGISMVTDSMRHLSPGDSARFITSDGEVGFNLSFDFVPEDMENLITRETLSSTTMMILKVKKPDYLGDSKWDFKHGTATIHAKITDAEWLDRFQGRKIDVRPMDSLRCEVLVKIKYDYDLNVVSESHEITRIIEVVDPSPGKQTEIPT